MRAWRKSEEAHLDVYLDNHKEWRFTLYAKNGAKLYLSALGFKDKDHAVEVAENLFPNVELVVHDRKGGPPIINPEND